MRLSPDHRPARWLGGKPARWQVAALTLKTTVDAAWSTEPAVDQATKHRAACSYRLATTALAFAGEVEAVRAVAHRGG